MTTEDDKKAIEAQVNKAATAMKALKKIATKHRKALTPEIATKIASYLAIVLHEVADELVSLAETNVPEPGSFTLDADIPAAPQPKPKTVYRQAEPEGRLVGQRKGGNVAQDPDDVGFIDD